MHVCDVDDAALASLAGIDPDVTSSRADVANRAGRHPPLRREPFTPSAVLMFSSTTPASPARLRGWMKSIPRTRDRTLQVNITGQFNCARLAVPHLRESSNASIINLSSAAGRFGFPLALPLLGAKWAAVGFTKTLAMELGPLGIRVNAFFRAWWKANGSGA